MPPSRLKSLRERVKRRERKTKARRRAKARRIRIGEPEGVGEALSVKSRQVKTAAKEKKQEAEMTAEEARALAGDVRRLAAVEAGIDPDAGRGAAKKAGSVLDRLADATEGVDDVARGPTGTVRSMQPPRPRRRRRGPVDPISSVVDHGIVDPGYEDLDNNGIVGPADPITFELDLVDDLGGVREFGSEEDFLDDRS